MKTTYRFPCGCEWPVVGPAPKPGALPLLDVDSERLPFCQATWELLGKGNTKGVFQLESSLGRTWTKKLKPQSAHHMGALGAILRPGALRAVDEEGVSMTSHYCRRKNGEEEVAKYHPAIDEILAPTYGCLVFQEEAMAIVKAVAGFDLKQADQLRKACGKKNTEEMAKVRLMFLEGAARAAILSKKQAEEVFGWIEKSQRYQFNASHAMSYGLTGYDTAYLKAHFPVAFYAAWLRYAAEKAVPLLEIHELVNDAKLNDIRVLPPDLRNLEPHFATDGVVVTFGLCDVKGIGEAQVAKLKTTLRQVEEKLKKPLAGWTWQDFLFYAAERVSTAVAVRLVAAGALDWLSLPRKQMAEELDTWMRLSPKEREWVRNRALCAQGLLAPEEVLPSLPPRPRREEDRFAGENQHKFRCSLAAWDKKQRLWQERLAELKALKPYTGLAAALSDLARPRKEGGGVASSRRLPTVKSLLYLSNHTASPMRDTPDEKAWLEEQYLGIALTCSRVDALDSRDVNATCKDFAAGRTGYLVLGVSVEQVRTVKTKRGKTPGQWMAFLTVADASCALGDVVCFTDAWKEYGGLLKEGNCVILQGERDQKQGSLIVKKVSQMAGPLLGADGTVGSRDNPGLE